MIFDKIFNANQQNVGALKPVAVANGGALASNGAAEETAVNASVEITNVWTGPIIVLSSDSQVELEKHYLDYSSMIPSESFEAIFRDQSLDKT